MSCPPIIYELFNVAIKFSLRVIGNVQISEEMPSGRKPTTPFYVLTFPKYGQRLGEGPELTLKYFGL